MSKKTKEKKDKKKKSFIGRSIKHSICTVIALAAAWGISERVNKETIKEEEPEEKSE